MDIGQAAEIFAHHIERIASAAGSGLDPNAREELQEAVNAFKRASGSLENVAERTSGLQKYGYRRPPGQR